MNTCNYSTIHDTGTPLEIYRCCPLVTLLSKLALALVLGLLFMVISYWS